MTRSRNIISSTTSPQTIVAANIVAVAADRAIDFITSDFCSVLEH
jgi:hypothetical protein